MSFTLVFDQLQLFKYNSTEMQNEIKKGKKSKPMIVMEEKV